VQVDGVEYLEGLRLGRVTGTTAAEQELIVVERWQVPAVVGLAVAIGPAPVPGAGESPQPPEKTPVPLPVEVC